MSRMWVPGTYADRRMRRTTLLLLIIALVVGPWIIVAAPRLGGADLVDLGDGSRFGPIDGVRDRVVGLAWAEGTPTDVEFRLDDGPWQHWHTQEGHGEDGGTPALGTIAHLMDGDRLEIRLDVAVSGAELYVSSRIEAASIGAAPVAAALDQPSFVTREQWGGDGCENYSVDDPGWTNRVRAIVVHHTSGSNHHSAGSVPTILQAICEYHVLGQKWTDIGYNFLIDRFGTIYEGRRSNADGDLAIGAHAYGINSQTVGIALLGDFDGQAPSAAAQESLVQLMAWLSETEHIDLDQTMTLTDPEGVAHTVKGLLGHKEVSETSCPGYYCTSRFPGFRQQVADLVGPRIFILELSDDHPRTGDELYAKFRFSEPMTWTFRAYDQSGTMLAERAGEGSYVDHTVEMEFEYEEVFYELEATTVADGTAPPPVLLSWHEHYEGTFEDDDDSPYQLSIERIAAEGITLGCDPDLPLFCPDEEVTRAQMATFIVRALELPPSGTDHFSDDDGHALEAEINAFAESGITYGCAEGRFCPEQIIPREQMAAFLARALALTPSEVNGFEDVAGYFTAEINAVAAAGIIVACNEDGTLFCPTQLVTREDMALFLDKGFLSQG